MRRLRPRWSSPALVLAGIALFVSLGGTGYAAVTLTRPAKDAASKKKKAAPKPLTKAQVNSLIAGYVKAHPVSGPAGAAGAAGTAGAAGAPV